MDDRDGREMTENGRGQEGSFQIQEKSLNHGSIISYARAII